MRRESLLLSSGHWAWMSGGTNHEIDVTAVDLGSACATRSGGRYVCRDTTFTLCRRGVRLLE